jgi:hypothetical protein
MLERSRPSRRASRCKLSSVMTCSTAMERRTCAVGSASFPSGSVKKCPRNPFSSGSPARF